MNIPINLHLLALCAATALASSAEAAVTNVAWYRLGENDPGAASGAAVTSPTTDLVVGKHLPQFGNPRYTNAVSTLASNRVGSSLAVQFNGTSQWLLTNALVSSAVNNFGIEAWVKPANVGPGGRAIAFNGNTGANGWGLYQFSNTYRGLLGGVAFVGNASATAGTWTHLALVRNNGTNRFYRDGAEIAGSITVPIAPNGAFAVAGNPTSPGFEAFAGAIDEVRVFTFAPNQFAASDLLANVQRVATLPASGLGPTNVTLNGRFHTVGMTTRGWFEWGLTTNYGNLTGLNTGTAGSGLVTFGQNVGGLAVNATYHFRAVASNRLGVVFGTNQSFKTLAPTVTTLPATGLGETTATLNGVANPGGANAKAWFEWGTTTNYGNVTPLRALGSGTSNTNFSQFLTGLNGSTTYHFRAAASNSFAVVFGTNQSFTTPAQTTITFEEFPDGTLVSENYASQGVHFLNDFRPSGGTRAAPRIVAHSPAPSPGNVLLNYANDWEIATSANAPLVFWFDRRQASVRMVLGATAAGGAPVACGGPYPATISFRDCNGNLLTQLTTNVSSSFNTLVQYSDPQKRIQRVNVDYGNIPCVEAMDNLSFTAGTGNCTDSSAPVITITSHTNDQRVVASQQLIQGYVTEPGILRSVLINGIATTFYLAADGRYYFEGGVLLQEGNNTITFIAENFSGRKGTAQLRLFLGTPASVTLQSFHLTQRGVMLDQPCDLDTPFVVGKTAIARLHLDVRTSNGMPTYASSVKLNVWRKTAGADLLVGSFFGNSYAPFLSALNSPTDLAAVHFWLPGYLHPFEVAGHYRFTVEAYVGSTLIGIPLRPCSGQYVSFQETGPVRLLILPVERGSRDSIFNGTSHVKNFYLQLDTIARAYPVRDGIGLFGVPNRGLIFQELSPLQLCDGPVTAQLEHCLGTDWTWDFIEKHPSGLLRRAFTADVLDAQNPTLCDPSNPIVGGRITTETTATYSYNPALGIYRVEARLNWPKDKHAIPQDEDHDGDVDAADLSFYMGEFFDTGTGRWTADLGLYDQGETFRDFQDLNGNSCFDEGADPLSLAKVRGVNEQSLLWIPAARALDELNQRLVAANAPPFRSASLWFPQPLIPPREFGATGPGQGNRPGRTSWIHVLGLVTMAHELGHNFDLPDMYYDTIPDDLRSIESAWAVYINGQSRPPSSVFEIMAVTSLPENEMFSKASYQTIFDQLKSTGFAAAANQFMISGIIYDDDGHADKIVTSLADGLAPSPVVAGSPYSLEFGQGDAILTNVHFGLDPRPEGHGGGQFDEVGYQTFHVVTAFPANAQWVELRNAGQSLTQITRSAATPMVMVLSPNGGESYGATQTVNIQWHITDADSTNLHSSVYYSPDNGANWLLLAAAFRGTNLLWDTVNWPGTTNGLIRVLVSDGFNTGEDQSNSRFSVAGKPPRVVILEPRPDPTILQCRRPIVRGIAEDLEGPITSTIWLVDSNQVGDQLEMQLPPLSPGPHVLRLEVLDGDNQPAFDEVTVQIVADSDCDGMSDDFEVAHGLNPGSVNDASVDTDGDGLSNFDEVVYGTDPTNPDTDHDLYPDGMELGVSSDPLDPLNTPFTTGNFTNALYVNAGGSALNDALGRLWRSDQPFLVVSKSSLASFVGSVDTSLLDDQYVPQGMLLTERSKNGHLNYQIPAPNGFYSVVLYFSENCLTCVSPNLGGTGPAGAARLFDVASEGFVIYSGYNQADAALPPSGDGQGATFKATQLVLRDVLVSDGMLNVDILDRGNGNPPDNAAIKGMAIIQQSAAGGLAPTRIVWIGRVGTLLRIKVDPGANRAAYYSGLTQLELQQSTDLLNWTSAGLPVGHEESLVVFETPFNGPARFYRIAARVTTP